MTNTTAGAPVAPSREPVATDRRLGPSVVTACAVMVVGAAALVASRSYHYWTPLGPGPGFFPRWQGGLLEPAGVVAVKAPVFSTHKLSGVDPTLGPAMQSTGEVIGLHTDARVAMAKGTGCPCPALHRRSR